MDVASSFGSETIRTNGSPPTTYSRDAFIDGLRGLAIFLVLSFHALGVAFGYDQLSWGPSLFRDFNVDSDFLLLLPASMGWSGVSIFFAVSGFCIHNSYSRERQLGIPRYLIKRIFRIYPPYAISLFLFFLWRPPYDFENLTWHIFLIHDFSDRYFFGINGVYWSIATEFQLYLIYLVLIRLIDKFGWRIIIIISFATEICVRAMESAYLLSNGNIPVTLQGFPFGYIFSWLIGALVAETCRGNQFRQRIGIYQPAILLISAVGSNFCKPLYPFSFMLFSVSTAATIAYVHNNETWRPRRMHWLISLGMVSYSLYLIHAPIMQYGPRILNFGYFGETSPVFTFLICVCMGVPLFVLSMWMRKYVEIPSINIGRRLLLEAGPRK